VWEVTEVQVTAAFQSDDGGSRFAEFVNALIRAEMYLSSTPEGVYALTSRSNLADGGVDGEVKRPIDNARSSWLREHPTSWQFTARHGNAATLAKLLEDLDKDKKYAVALIKKGYAWRACIRGNLTPEKLTEWERDLTNAARAHNPDAPAVCVLTARRLADWASMFPGVAPEHLGLTLPGGVLHFSTWEANATADTPTFVDVPSWADVRSSINRHVDFGTQPVETVLDVRGESGVGKTRLVFETLRGIKGAGLLAVYAPGETDALGVATYLANAAHTSAILVADECGPQASRSLAELLRGSKARVRVVSIIGPEPQRLRTRTDSLVQQMPTDILEKVLEKNFPQVSKPDQRAIASQTQGFVRLASYMCRLALAGRGVNLDEALAHLDQHMPHYVGPGSPSDTLHALSLLKKVGFKDDMRPELVSLCSLAGGLNPDDISSAGKHLRDSCGFVGVAGRYMYVTPPIVARWAFEAAWRRWAADDVAGFLKKVPPGLLQGFLDQVSDVGNATAQEEVSRFFEDWASALSPLDLAKIEITDLLEALTETRPATYLPRLRKIMESASDGELASIVAEGQSGRWGPRLHLMWLARHLAAFNESFDDAEVILFRLAVSEPKGNWRYNAGETWVHLFRMRLSGTEKPYVQRLALLKQRLFADDPRESALALRALKEAIGNALADFITGDSLPEFVGGRQTPREWRADSQEEGVRLMHELLGLLRDVATSTRPDIAEPAADMLVGMTETLLDEQELEFLKDDTIRGVFTKARLPKVLQDVEVFLVRQERYVGQERRLPEAYLSDVRAWKAGLTPDDLHSRVVATTGRDAYFYTRAFRTTTEPTELVELAKELYSNPGAISNELAWLLSPDAKSAEALGVELGKLDAEASMLDLLYAESAKTGSALLARGYTTGLLTAGPEAAGKVNRAIDSLEANAPDLAFECSVVGGELTHVLPRGLSQVQLGRLKADRLVGFLWFIGNRRPTASEFAEILGAIALAVADMNEGLLSWAVTLVAYRLHDDGKGETEPILGNQRAREGIWTCLEAVVDKGDLRGESRHWFPEILEELLKFDPERATSLATKGLMSESVRLGEACERVLAQLAKEHPTTVMKCLGPLMLDPKTAWRFHVDQYVGIFWALNEDILKGWLVENGVPAALALARHLPRPYLDKDKPIIPSLTEFVLTKFEEDDGVAAAFMAGIHGSDVGSGDISSYFQSRAKFARHFLGHPLRRVLEWAEAEVQSCEADAARFKQMEEERWL
jgi:hypothetical protein